MLFLRSPRKIPLLFLSGAIVALGIYVSIFTDKEPAESVWMSDHEIKTDAEGNRLFAGTVENSTNPAENLQIVLTFFKEDGGFVGSASADRKMLGPDETWNFEIRVPAQAESFRVQKQRWKDVKLQREFVVGPHDTQSL